MRTNEQQHEEQLIDLEDLEEAAREGRKPRSARRYRIRVNKQHLEFEVSSATGREILERAGKTPPERFLLVQRLRGGGQQNIDLDEAVDFTTPGIERFITLPRDQREGREEGELRKQFALPEEDLACLQAHGYAWETVHEGRKRWLLIHGFGIPSGYTIDRATLALHLHAAYPDAQIDMAYFDPPLARSDNVGIKALARQRIDGRDFQRWSRHRTKENPWRPGEDDVCTHLTLVDDWLRRELNPKAA